MWIIWSTPTYSPIECFVVMRYSVVVEVVVVVYVAAAAAAAACLHFNASFSCFCIKATARKFAYALSVFSLMKIFGRENLQGKACHIHACLYPLSQTHTLSRNCSGSLFSCLIPFTLRKIFASFFAATFAPPLFFAVPPNRHMLRAPSTALLLVIYAHLATFNKVNNKVTKTFRSPT